MCRLPVASFESKETTDKRPVAVSCNRSFWSNNTTTCKTIEAIHSRRKLLPWIASENQLPFITCFFRSCRDTDIFAVYSCLGHVINLANVDVMSHITKITAVETSTAIWEYDPSLAGNRVLGGSLDVIAAIRTLAIKVRFQSLHLVCCSVSLHYIDPSLWSTYRGIPQATNRMRNRRTPQDTVTQQCAMGHSIPYAQ